MERITEVIDFLNGTRILQPTIVNTREEFYKHQSIFPFDFAEVKGQENVKRALEVAAAADIMYCSSVPQAVVSL